MKCVIDNHVNVLRFKAEEKSIQLKIKTAADGQQALESLGQEDFYAVLMDCQMPRMNGYEATRRIRRIRRIRRQDKFKDLPILAMTANAMKGDREKVLAVGMNDHIAKPVNPSIMFATMAKWIKSAPNRYT